MANDLQRRDGLFDNLMNMRNFFDDGFFAPSTANYMKSDVTESHDGYQVKIDMPGFDKKDIHVNYADGILTVSGHRDTFDDHTDNNGNIIQSERRYGQMSRSYRLPDVDLDKVSAKYNDGVLALDLPKLTVDNQNGTHIDIE
ncbi:Hsp20/alpha crystallin family protein [Limosilactobacillus caecicola]|uniref:Hsp20/alpha crystallin family protein n=1 Tax=Limosilactobacillus caecicola TaxID=2941332 RepID=UPI00203E8932|nr:Hsp20/alpha crystallin family protein [Limosilactobacillus caecicola]